MTSGGMIEVFAALGESNRFEMVRRLARRGSQRLGTLVADLPITRQAATRHLHVLQSSGIVRIERQGREQMCRLDPTQIQAAEQFLALLESQWDSRLASLKRLLDE